MRERSTTPEDENARQGRRPIVDFRSPNKGNGSLALGSSGCALHGMRLARMRFHDLLILAYAFWDPFRWNTQRKESLRQL